MGWGGRLCGREQMIVDGSRRHVQDPETGGNGTGCIYGAPGVEGMDVEYAVAYMSNDRGDPPEDAGDAGSSPAELG